MMKPGGSRNFMESAFDRHRSHLRVGRIRSQRSLVAFNSFIEQKSAEIIGKLVIQEFQKIDRIFCRDFF